MVAEILGGIANGLFNQFGVANAVQAQKDLISYQARTNYNYSQKDLKTKWAANRKGLESAGYNPMLALAGVNSNSNWASQSSVGDTGTGSSFGTGIANAIQSRQVQQQGNLMQSQIDNYNADSVLKQNQAVTELYSQLEKINHADLMNAERQLTDKNVSWYDKQQAREDLRVANEIERTGNDFKVGMANAIANQINANSNSALNRANATAVNIENQKAQNYYNVKTPKRGKFQQYLYNFGKAISDFTGLGRLSLPRH